MSPEDAEAMSKAFIKKKRSLLLEPEMKNAPTSVSQKFNDDNIVIDEIQSPKLLSESNIGKKIIDNTSSLDDNQDNDTEKYSELVGPGIIVKDYSLSLTGACVNHKVDTNINPIKVNIDEIIDKIWILSRVIQVLKVQLLKKPLLRALTGVYLR